MTKNNENNDAIPFLDILINRKINNITTAVYRKLTSYGIFLICICARYEEKKDIKKPCYMGLHCLFD